MLDSLPNSTCESSELEESPHLISTSWARFATWPWVFGKPTTAENSKHLRFTFFQRTRFFNKMPKNTDLIVRVARTCSFLLPPARQQQISRINEVTNAVQGTVLHGQGARRDGLCFHVIYWSRRDFNKRLNTSSNQVFTVKRSYNRSHCPFPSWRKQSSWASSCPAEDARVSIVPRQYRVSRLITARNGVRTDSQMLRTTFATSDHELYSRYAPEWFSSPILEVFRFQFRAGIRVEEKINIQVEMRDLQCQCRDSFPGAAG